MKRNSLRWLIFSLMITFVFSVIGLAQQNGDPTRGQQLISLARQAIGGEARLNEIPGLELEGKINRPGQAQENAAKLKLVFMTRTLAGVAGHGVAGQINEDVEFNVELNEPNSEGTIRIFKDKNGNEHKIDADRVMVFKNSDGNETKTNERMVIITKKEAKDLNENSKTTKVEKDVVINVLGGSGDPNHLPPIDLVQAIVGLLLKSPLPVEFSYIGDAENGTADAIKINDNTEFSTVLLLDKSTHLPIGLNYYGSLHQPIFVTAKKGERINIDQIKKSVEVKEDQKTEIKLRFSDHRLVDGVLLPHHISKSINGEIIEEYNIEKYDLNPSVKVMSLHKMKKDN
ncbi:MAG: hypothetical protein HY819_18625 [Acidobacteria bacterium]|nr:hypothetical protein [Acidobacteriota bacterium]